MYKGEFFKRTLSTLVASSLLAASVPVSFAAGEMPGPSPSQAITQNTFETEVVLPTPTQQRNTYVIPAGTGMRVTSSMTSPRVGDTFSAELVDPISLNGTTVIPAGSVVQGEVMAVSINEMDVQFRQVALSNGDTIPIRARTSVAALQGTVAQESVAEKSENLAHTFYPRIEIGGKPLTGPQKVLAGTLGGAVFGAASGALSGLVMPAVYRDDIDYGEGTGAARGALWGGIMGSGLGMVSGLIAAGADRRQTSTTTSRTRQTVAQPTTNIRTGSLEEIPVSYQAPASTTTMETTTSMTTSSAAPMGKQMYMIILDEPVTITR